MILKGKRELIFLTLGGVFIANALLAEILGSKLIQLGTATFSLGILCWPVVFVVTDLINEYFGKQGVKQLTFLTTGLIIYAYLVIWIGRQIPATSFSPVNDSHFDIVFGQSSWLIAGSLLAFLTSQLVDVFVFWALRERTHGGALWLRATGSTLVSQLIDTFIVMFIAFYLPPRFGVVHDGQIPMTFSQYLNLSSFNYLFKFIIAVGVTPLIYAAHGIIDRVLQKERGSSNVAV